MFNPLKLPVMTEAEAREQSLKPADLGKSLFNSSDSRSDDLCRASLFTSLVLSSDEAASTEVNEHGNTRLHHAAKAGNAQLASIVIKAGDLQLLSQPNHDGKTAFDIAVEAEDYEFIWLLLHSGIVADRANDPFANQLLLASQSGEGWEQRALIDAVTVGDFTMAEFLLRKGVDVNTADQAGWSLAHHAATQGQLDILWLLQSYGVDYSSRTPEGDDVLMLLMRCNSEGLSNWSILADSLLPLLLGNLGEYFVLGDEEHPEVQRVVAREQSRVINVKSWRQLQIRQVGAKFSMLPPPAKAEIKGPASSLYQSLGESVSCAVQRIVAAIANMEKPNFTLLTFLMVAAHNDELSRCLSEAVSDAFASVTVTDEQQNAIECLSQLGELKEAYGLVEKCEAMISFTSEEFKRYGELSKPVNWLRKQMHVTHPPLLEPGSLASAAASSGAVTASSSCSSFSSSLWPDGSDGDRSSLDATDAAFGLDGL